MNDNFWEENKDEAKHNLRLGSSYPPVQLFLDMMEISKINSREPLTKTVILSDGKEVDIEILLETDKDKFAKNLKEAIDAKTDDSD
jgi:hypothetical protein